MSDAESSRPVSPTRSNHQFLTSDEGLHDHRNQPTSLPIREPYETQIARSHSIHLRHLYLHSDENETDTDNPSSNIPESRNLNHVSTIPGSGGSLAASRRGRSRSRSHSFTEQVRSLVRTKDSTNSNKSSEKYSSGGILLNTRKGSVSKRGSFSNGNVKIIDGNDNAVFGSEDERNDGEDNKKGSKPVRERRGSKVSVDSDADSHASRSSQETEEDVCFPIVPEHVRVNGIDFDAMTEFIDESNAENLAAVEIQRMLLERGSNYSMKGAVSTTSAKPFSSAALKYTPKNILRKTSIKNAIKKIGSSKDAEFVNESPSFLEDQSKTYKKASSTKIPATDTYEKERSSDSSTVTAESESEKVQFGGTRIQDAAPPDRFSFFSAESDETIHAPDFPSLSEDSGKSISELFGTSEGPWWLDCSCPTDTEMKMLTKAFNIHPLTSEDIRMQETREKFELFRNYYFVCFHTFDPDPESEDFLEPINVYMVIFKEGLLTFHFTPISHPANVRRRVRQLRDYVDVSADWLCYAMVDDITDSFAPLITSVEHEADAIEDSVFVARELDFRHMLQRIGESRRKVMTLMRLLSGKADVIKIFAKRCQDEDAKGRATSHTNLSAINNYSIAGVQSSSRAQPRAEIALYLGDIQDHVVTMFQNLLAYEKIFSRSHANYLGQLQVESFNANNRVTEMLSKVTLIGTMLVPLNLITGLFGMNVHVPGQDGSNLGWFFGIVGVIVVIVIVSLFFANIWLKSMETKPANGESSRRSIRSLGFRSRARPRSGTRSILSFSSRLNRFEE